MPTISNKTRKPLRVPLPGGKILRLGPLKEGQVAANAVEFPALKALVEAGEIEIVDGASRRSSGASGGGPSRSSNPGQTGGGASGVRHSGDR